MDNPLPLAVEAVQGVVKYSDNQEEIKSIRENMKNSKIEKKHILPSNNFGQMKFLTIAFRFSMI